MLLFITLAAIIGLVLVFIIFSGKASDPLEKYAGVEFADFINENDDWVVMDTETTRLGKNAEVLEISVVDKTGNVLLDTLVNPKGPISRNAQNVHGISRKMVKSAPPWPEIAKGLQQVTSGRAVIAYNAQFDLDIIRQTCEKWGVEFPLISGLCAMKAWSDHIGQRRWCKLIDACAAKGIEIENQHRALGDAEATRRLVLAIASDK